MRGFPSFQWFLWFTVASVCARDPELDKPVRELVERHGYPFEVHEVTTNDDYLLGVHRIPASHNETDDNGLPPVLLMHGLLGASPDWVVTGPNRSLAFMLSDSGFDVWIGNNRGCTFSKAHKTIKTSSFKFWDFSWHELGMFDTPAMIDYILEATNHTRLHYVCFSQGCTQFFVMASMRPEYNDKVILATALAPAAYTGHINGILRPISTFVGFGRLASEWTFYFEMLPNTRIVSSMSDYFCRKGSPVQYMCELIVFIIGGFSEDKEIDKAHFAEYLHYVPAGCSTKQLLHYGMGAMSGRFRQYDYGIFKNLRLYHSIFPPDYNLTSVKAPVAVYNGLNDWLADLADVAELVSQLPNVVSMKTIKLERLNHFDFLFGVDIKALAYDDALERILSYSEKENAD